MPVIPIFQRRQSISGEPASVPGNIGAAGIVGEAVAQAGARGMAISADFADLVARHNEQLRKQNNAFAVLKAQNSIDEDVRSFKQTYDEDVRSFKQTDETKSAVDPGMLLKFTKDREDAFSKFLDEKYLASVTDADQKLRIEQYRNSALDRVLDHTAVYQANFRKDFAKTEISRALDLSLTSIHGGADYETEINAFREKVGTLHVTGAISALDMEEIIIKAERQIIGAYLDTLIANNPIKARQEIKSGKYIELLPAEQYRHYAAKAESLGQAEDKIGRENSLFDAVYNKFSDPITGKVDIALAIRSAQVDKKIGDLDLSAYDPTIRRSVVSRLGDIDASQQKQRKDQIDATLAPVFKQLSSGNYPAARQAIAKLAADPANPDISDTLFRMDAAADAGIKAAIKDAEGTAAEKARIKAQANSEMLNEIYSGRYQSEADVIIGATVKGLGMNSNAWVGIFHEYNKRNGETNFWPQVISRIEADAKEIDDFRKYQGDIINSIEYYRQHPAELDKSLGDQPIDVRNPKILDIYEKFKERADKNSILDYDVRPFLRKLPQGSPFTVPASESRNAPVPGAKESTDGNWYVPDPKRPGKYLKVN